MASCNNLSDPFRHWRYLPSPVIQVFNRSIVHPQPRRPFLNPLHYLIDQNNEEEIPTLAPIDSARTGWHSTPANRPSFHASLRRPDTNSNGSLSLDSELQTEYQASGSVPESVERGTPPHRVNFPQSGHRTLVPADAPPPYPSTPAPHNPIPAPAQSYNGGQSFSHPEPWGAHYYLGRNHYRGSSPIPPHAYYCHQDAFYLPDPFSAAPSTQPTEMEVTFEELEAHTGKCDVCDARSSQGMSRCKECSWQTCYQCIIQNGADRSHVVQGRTHSGYIDEKRLVPKTPTKTGKRRQPASFREDPETLVSTKTPARLTRASVARLEAATTTGPSGPISRAEAYPDAISETESVVNGAANLYAFSLEAQYVANRQQRLEAYLEIEVLTDDDDGTEIMSDVSEVPVNTRSQAHKYMHNLARQQAQVAVACHRRRSLMRRQAGGVGHAGGSGTRMWKAPEGDLLDSDAEATEPIDDTDIKAAASKLKAQKTEPLRSDKVVRTKATKAKGGIVKKSKAQSNDRRRLAK